MNIEDFYTLDKENEGSKMYLYDPQDRKTDEWILVYGGNSDVATRADFEYNRQLAELANESSVSDDDRYHRAKSITTRKTSKLIKAWSFDLECNDSNKVKLLTQSPKTAERVEYFAKKGSLFFKNEEKKLSQESES